MQRAPKHALADLSEKEPHPEAVEHVKQSIKPNLPKATHETNEGNPAVFKSLEALRDSTNIDEPVTSPKKCKPQATSTKELENTKQSNSKLDEHEQRKFTSDDLDYVVEAKHVIANRACRKTLTSSC